jgi:hypothetical protein
MKHITRRGSVPNAQAGLGQPIAYDDEMFALVREKLARLRQILDCPLHYQLSTPRK